MKTKNKILVIILTIILALTMMPIVSNASTLTISNSEPTSNSSSYSVYKILSKTETGYELTEKAADYFKNYVTATVNNGTEKKLASVDEVLEYLTDLASSASTSETDNTVAYSPATKEEFAKNYINKVTADSAENKSKITLDDGYYLIYDENGEPKSQNMLVEVKGDTSITVKAVGVTLEKQATNGDSHYVGETVNFTIKTVVPNMKGYSSPYTFTISDEAKNLKIKSETVKVLIGGTEIKLGDKIKTTDTTLEVALGDYLYDANKDSETLAAGTEILVNYDAVITADAIEGSVATNSASLKYSNDPNTNSTKTIQTPDSEKVYTYSVKFNKKSTLGKSLTGAKFVLKTSVEEDNNGQTVSKEKYISIDEKTKAITLVDPDPEADNKVPTSAYVFKGGEFTISGLKEGTYELVETEAPSGYTKADGLVFTISNNDYSKIGTSEPPTVDHTLSKPDTAKNLELITDKGLNGFEANVINSKTTFLPTTGGIGTTIFTVSGIVLMILAVVALVVINKKNNR